MADADSKKKEPEFVYDAANESIVISAAIADATIRKRLVHQLAADEFLVSRHAAIWQALRHMADSDLQFTAETATRLLKDAGGDESATQYMIELAEEARVPDNLDWHVQTMGWDATRARTLQGPVPEFLIAMRDAKAEVADVLTSARRIVRALEGRARRFIHRPAELHRSYRAEIAARRMERNVYPIGLESFDEHLTEGFMPARTTVVSGLPGSGKTTVMVAWSILLAKMGRRVLYCAWEMDAESLLDVAVSHMLGIPLRSIVQGTLDDAEVKRIDAATRWITSRITFMANPFLRVSGKPSNDRNLDELEGYLAESGCDVVVYDLWERMLRYRSPDDVAGALYRLQDMHVEYGIHGIVVQQLRLKDVEARQDKRPTREAIKGSGAYVEVADLIFGIHRDAQFKDIPDEYVETINLKQRKGKAFWANRWRWDGERCYVGDPETVPFNPGLEAVAEGADTGEETVTVKGIKTRRGSGRRTSK